MVKMCGRCFDMFRLCLLLIAAICFYFARPWWRCFPGIMYVQDTCTHDSVIQAYIIYDILQDITSQVLA